MDPYDNLADLRRVYKELKTHRFLEPTSSSSWLENLIKWEKRWAFFGWKGFKSRRDFYDKSEDYLDSVLSPTAAFDKRCVRLDPRWRRIEAFCFRFRYKEIVNVDESNCDGI